MNNNPNRVLQDHVKKGKVFTPPFLAAFAPYNDVSWHHEILPEVIWIGLLHSRFGENNGTAMALAFAQGLVAEGCGTMVGFDSEIASSDPIAKANAKAELMNKGMFDDILDATKPLIRYAPQTGLSSLDACANESCDDSDREAVKKVVQQLFDKESRYTVMVQATVVYIAFVLDRLKTAEGLALARFPEIADYPETEISLKIASAVRTSLMMLFSSRDENAKKDWANNFWNQGIQSEPCSI